MRGAGNDTISVEIVAVGSVARLWRRDRDGGVVMMKLSSTSDYGIRALVDLAQHDGAGPIPSSEIAERQQIPPSLAGQVLGRLRAGGLWSRCVVRRAGIS